MQTVYLDRTENQHPVPLAQAMAISSGFMASFAHDKLRFLQDVCCTERLGNYGVLDQHGGRQSTHVCIHNISHLSLEGDKDGTLVTA